MHILIIPWSGPFQQPGRARSPARNYGTGRVRSADRSTGHCRTQPQSAAVPCPDAHILCAGGVGLA